METMTILGLLTRGVPYFVIGIIVLLTYLMFVLKNIQINMKLVHNDIEKIKDSMLWPDVFKRFEQNINEHFKELDRRITKLENKVFNGG